MGGTGRRGSASAAGVIGQGIGNNPSLAVDERGQERAERRSSLSKLLFGGSRGSGKGDPRRIRHLADLKVRRHTRTHTRTHTHTHTHTHAHTRTHMKEREKKETIGLGSLFILSLSLPLSSSLSLSLPLSTTHPSLTHRFTAH